MNFIIVYTFWEEREKLGKLIAFNYCISSDLGRAKQLYVETQKRMHKIYLLKERNSIQW